MDDPDPAAWPRRARERALEIATRTPRTVRFVADRIERPSGSDGSLAVAFTLLFWLFVVSRVIVASAMLNAALAHRRRPTPKEVLHA